MYTLVNYHYSKIFILYQVEDFRDPLFIIIYLLLFIKPM